MMEKRNFACYSKHRFLMDKKYLLKNGWKVCPREVPVETNHDMKCGETSTEEARPGRPIEVAAPFIHSFKKP